MSRTVVITGAGSGIGLAASLYFARKGWQIGMIGRGEPALRDAKSAVEAAGAAAHVAKADVSDEAALEHAADEIEIALGPIDVWVNNAGISFYGKFSDIPASAFERVIQVNLLGTVNGTRVALKRMRKRNCGTIIQILSAISYRGVPLQSAYSATKYGLRGFTESVRAELLHEGSAVHITMVHPPAVNTPFYSHAGSVLESAPRPPPPIYQPELIAEAIYFAANKRRREWPVTGTTVAFKLGNKLAPGLLDRVAGLVGVATQQTRRGHVVAARDPNTFSPASNAKGTHGPFDSESRATSAQWFVRKHEIAFGFGLTVFALGLLYRVRRQS